MNGIMEYRKIDSLLDLVNVFSEDGFTKSDLADAIIDYEEFKEDNELFDDVVVIEIDEDGDYGFLTEDEYKELMTAKVEPKDSVPLGHGGYDMGAVAQNDDDKKVIQLQEYLIKILEDKPRSIVELAELLNGSSDSLKIIPTLDGKPTIDLDEILDQIAPPNFKKQITDTIYHASKTFVRGQEYQIVALSGTYSSLMGYPITTKDDLIVAIKNVIDELKK